VGYAFVSYSRHDRRADEAIDLLLDALRSAGLNLWLAPDSVPAGSDWQHTVTQAVERADAVIAIVTRRIVKATGMRREIAQAVELGIPVIAVSYGTVPEANLPEALYGAAFIPLLPEDISQTVREIAARVPAGIRDGAPAPSEVPPRSRGYVFISYAEEDTAFVQQLRAFMQERGYGYWDYQDSERNYQVQLFIELEEVIRNATATLSVLSPDWKKSQWAVQEYLYSREVNVPVFLLMARPMEPSIVIAGLPYIDFTRDQDEGFDRLDRELKRRGLI
jgi:hypothetical protein